MDWQYQSVHASTLWANNNSSAAPAVDVSTHRPSIEFADINAPAHNQNELQTTTSVELHVQTELQGASGQSTGSAILGDGEVSWIPHRNKIGD